MWVDPNCLVLLIFVTQEIATVRVTIKEQKTRGENFKRIKVTNLLFFPLFPPYLLHLLLQFLCWLKIERDQIKSILLP